MRKVLAISVVVVVFAMTATAFAQGTKEIGVITKAELQQLAAKLKAGEVKGSVMVFNSADRYALTTSFFAGKKQVPHLHAGHDEIMLILAGGGKFTLGGQLVNGAPEDGYKWDEVMGSDIKGGKTYEVKEGDIISAPRGVPHVMDATGTSVVYMVVKVPFIPPYVRKMELGE